MLNYKIICVNARSNDFTTGKIYKVVNGAFFDDNGNESMNFVNIKQINEAGWSDFELYEEPKAVRTCTEEEEREFIEMLERENNTSPIADSGNRREFETGAVRDMQEGKGRCDLLPAAAILRLAKHFENGCKKYGDRNWEKGIPIHSFIDSAIRHLMKYLDGQVDEDHLCAAAWNCICAMWTEEKHPELQDIPSRVAADIKTPDVPDKDVGEIEKGCKNCKFIFLNESDCPCNCCNHETHDKWECENNDD